MWMLDNNTVSDLLKAMPAVLTRLAAVPVGSVCLSAVTAGELHYGLAKRPDKRALHAAVQQLLLRVPVLPWTQAVAEEYGLLRASLESKGRTLGALDMMIAAHAKQSGCVLVSNDAAFSQVDHLNVEDWRR